MNARRIKSLISTAVAIFLFVIFAFFDPLGSVEYQVQDFAFQRASVTHPDIFVIGIDEDALEMFGAWPFDRGIMAAALEILNACEFDRPAVIGIDVMYSEASHNSAHDARLIDAVRTGGNIVLPSSAVVRRDMYGELAVRNVSVPFYPLYSYAPYGLVNALVSRDGVIRYAPLWIEFENVVYYSFPMVVARKYADYWGYALDESFVQAHSETYLSFTGMPGEPGAFFTYSFADIFEDWFYPGWMAGGIVLIGPYAMGMMDDHAVAIRRDVAMYGVEIHANTIQLILENNFKTHAPSWAGVAFIAVFLLIGMLLGEKVRLIIYAPAIVLIGVFYWLFVMFIFAQGYLLPLLAPLVVLGVMLAYQVTYNYILASREKGRMRLAFGKYVDPILVDKLISTGGANSDAVGKKMDIAVLFVDMRGFTAMTESLKDQPEMVVEILNQYLEMTSKSIFYAGGSIDKFIGDATMALFNGFIDLDDYEFKAVTAAWNMVQQAEELNKKVKNLCGIDVGFGVGVHVGEAIVGNLGPSFRKDYTAIGDAVNIAARLEASAEKSQIVISADLHERVKDRVQVKPLGKASFKGKKEQIDIYEVVKIS